MFSYCQNSSFVLKGSEIRERDGILLRNAIGFFLTEIMKRKRLIGMKRDNCSKCDTLMQYSIHTTYY